MLCLSFALDEHFNFNRHVNDMKQLVTHKLYLFSKIRKYINVQTSMNIFKTKILSLIEYGNIIYKSTLQTHLNSIDRMFYRGLHICLDTNNHMSKGVYPLSYNYMQ